MGPGRKQEGRVKTKQILRSKRGAIYRDGLGREAGLREGGSGFSYCCTASHDLRVIICIEVTLKPIFHWKLALRLGTQRNLYSTDLCWGLASGVMQILCFALGDAHF